MTRPATAPSPAIRIRPYRREDFDALCEIDRACYDPLIAYSRREMRAYISRPGSECVVAEIGKIIAGFCIATREFGQGYIITIDVLSAFRKHGVGSALLAESEKRLVAHGVREIDLDTAVDNHPAIAFWQKHGYRKIGIRKGYYPNGRDAFAMVKMVTP